MKWMTAVRLFLFCGLLVFFGCSKEGKLITVKGTVTLDDQPFEVGMVFFEQLNSTEKFQATLSNSGTFETKLPAGKYNCYIQNFMFKMQAEKGAAVSGIGGLSGKFIPVPEKYTKATTSGFTLDGPPEKVEFKMSSKAQ